MAFRVGHGYDVHRLVYEKKLILGGVEIPFEKGLLGHSDADVLTHAITDALLGAAGQNDIGHLFPDSCEELKDVSSLILLEEVYSLLNKLNWQIENIDATIVCQKPKLAPFKDAMKKNISKVLKLDESALNIKATTEEGLGFTGSSEGIAAFAVCMLKGKGDL